MFMKINVRILYVILTCLLTIHIFGCGATEDDAEPANSSPIVDAFVIPSEFTPSEIIEFRVLAYDNDGDPLTYNWEVDAGKLDQTTGTKVKWTAPEDVESVKVTVYVSDGITRSTKRVKKIANTDFIQPEPEEKPFDPVPDPPLNSIVPGKGAVGIKLGDPFKKVEDLYGKPDDPLGRFGYFSYDNQNIGLSGFVDGINLVRDLFLDRPNKAKTAGGNGIGNTVERVEKELGKAQEIDQNKHWYWRRGIQFTYNADKRVELIYVFKPIAAAPTGGVLPLAQNQKLKKINAVRNEITRLKRSEK